MKKLAIFLLVLVATGPAIAAEPDANADNDMRCAILAAYGAGTVEDEKSKQGLSYSMTYFIGRFEGATGRKFEEVATVDYILGLMPELEGLRQPCAERMKSFGGRLQVWGRELQKSEASKK